MKTYICKTCKKEKHEKEFSKHSGCKIKLDISRCKLCKKSKQDWKKVSLDKKIYHRLKSRSKLKNLEFNLELSDIIIPNKCPVFNIPFIYGDKNWTYSVDRIDNSKGYIKGNIIIISNRANRLKGDFSIEELKTMVNYLSNNCEIK
jgi:hypothetical protein